MENTMVLIINVLAVMYLGVRATDQLVTNWYGLLVMLHQPHLSAIATGHFFIVTSAPLLVLGLTGSVSSTVLAMLIGLIVYLIVHPVIVLKIGGSSEIEPYGVYFETYLFYQMPTIKFVIFGLWWKYVIFPYF